MCPPSLTWLQLILAGEMRRMQARPVSNASRYTYQAVRQSGNSNSEQVSVIILPGSEIFVFLDV